MVSSADGSALVSNSQYTQLLIDNNSTPDSTEATTVCLRKFDSDHKQICSDEIIAGKNVASSKIKEGKVKALIDLKDVTLPESKEKIKALKEHKTTNINRVHNSGSPWPPKTTFKSEKIFRQNEEIDVNGKLSIFVVEEMGHQIEGDFGGVNGRVIDFDQFKSASLSGSPTIDEIIDELNIKLDSSLSASRAAIGKIVKYNDDGAIVDGAEYLLSNINLVANSDLDNNTCFFDLELESSSHLGSLIKFSEIKLNGVETNINLDDFRLEKGCSTK